MPSQVQCAGNVYHCAARCTCVGIGAWLHILQERDRCICISILEKQIICSLKIAYAKIANDFAVPLRHCHSGNPNIDRSRRICHIVIPNEFRRQGDCVAVLFCISLQQYFGGADGHGISATFPCLYRIGNLNITHEQSHLSRSRCSITAPQTCRRLCRSRPGSGRRGLDGDGVIGIESSGLGIAVVGFYIALKLRARFQERDGLRECICITFIICISGGISQIICLFNRQCPAAYRKGLPTNRNAFVQLAGQPGCNIRRPVLPGIIEVGGDRDHIRRQIFGGERTAAA